MTKKLDIWLNVDLRVNDIQKEIYAINIVAEGPRVYTTDPEIRTNMLSITFSQARILRDCLDSLIRATYEADGALLSAQKEPDDAEN